VEQKDQAVEPAVAEETNVRSVREGAQERRLYREVKHKYFFLWFFSSWSEFLTSFRRP
jgi:hypothetical protein